MAGVGLSFLVHYLSFMLSLTIVTCDVSYMDLPVHHLYAGRFKYLTFISFICGLVYYNLAAIIDFMIWVRGKDSPLWRNVRDYIFAAVITPFAIFVCTMFWTIYLLDPSAMRDTSEIALIPWWIDHGYHTFPIIAVFLQAYLVEHSYPRKKMAFLLLLVLEALYLCWLFWIAYRANYWVYPFLARMSAIGLALFLAVSVTISFGFYFIGEKFTNTVWGKNKNKAP